MAILVYPKNFTGLLRFRPRLAKEGDNFTIIRIVIIRHGLTQIEFLTV